MNKVYILLLLLFTAIAVPSLGALDKATTQWLLLSLTPILFFPLIDLKSKSFTLFIYAAFIVQVFLSLIYTNNFSVSIIDASRHLVLFIISIILSSLLISKKFNFYFISILVSLFLIYESLVSLYPLFNYIYDNGILSISRISSIDINQFKGLTGNRNITTASFVIKLPFLFYVFYRSKVIFKPFVFIIALVPLFSLFIINSRAALLSFLFSLLFYSIHYIFVERKALLNLLYIYGATTASYLLAFLFLPSKSKNTLERLSSIDVSNESSSQRFFLWENALDFISNHPFIGSGIGNWKIESAAYWSSLGSSYLVPYHAHNDFLEFSTEIGVLGGLTYFALFIFIFFSFFRNYLVSRDFKFLVLFLSFLALFIDSLLNFPFERPIIQVMFVLLLSLCIFYNKTLDDQKA